MKKFIRVTLTRKKKLTAAEIKAGVKMLEKALNTPAVLREIRKRTRNVAIYGTSHPEIQKGMAQARSLAESLLPPKKKRKKLGIVLLALLITAPAYSAPHYVGARINSKYDQMAIRAVIGEAGGEGFDGMYAVACAIRNRGTLRGVQGRYCSLKKVSGSTWQKASRAWYTSEEGRDVTHGATNWENVGAFGRPWWSYKMQETAIIGHHHFYKNYEPAHSHVGDAQ